MPYVIIYNPELRIVGPFANHAEASKWGAQWQEEHGDNPCWNTIDLDGAEIDYVRITVEHP